MAVVTWSPVFRVQGKKREADRADRPAGNEHDVKTRRYAPQDQEREHRSEHGAERIQGPVHTEGKPQMFSRNA